VVRVLEHDRFASLNGIGGVLSRSRCAKLYDWPGTLEVFWLRRKVLVAILLHDFVDMIVAHLALGIAGEDRRISNVELGSECQDDAVRNIGRIRQEGPQEPNRTELQGKAQARMVVTARV